MSFENEFSLDSKVIKDIEIGSIGPGSVRANPTIFRRKLNEG